MDLDTINAGEIEKIRRAVPLLMREALVHASDKSTYLSKPAKDAYWIRQQKLAHSLSFS